MAKLLGIVIAAIVFGAAPAAAQFIVEPHTATALGLCEREDIYAPGDANAPAIVARSFAGPGKVVTMRVCKDSDGNAHYFIRKPRPNRDGICRVVEDEVFPGGQNDHVIVDTLYDGTAPGWYFDLPGWKPWPPSDWTALHYRPQARMLAFVTAAAAACPRTDDARYIPVVATDGMLKSFFDIWRAATTSPESFDRFFAGVPVRLIPGFERLGTARTIPALRKAVFGNHEDIGSIDCEVSGLGTASGCTAWIDLFSISFDVTDRGLVFTGVWENPVI